MKKLVYALALVTTVAVAFAVSAMGTGNPSPVVYSYGSIIQGDIDGEFTADVTPGTTVTQVTDWPGAYCIDAPSAADTVMMTGGVSIRLAGDGAVSSEAIFGLGGFCPGADAFATTGAGPPMFFQLLN